MPVTNFMLPLPIHNVVGTQNRRFANDRIRNNTDDEFYNHANKTFGLQNDSLVHKIQIPHTTSIDTKKTRCLQLTLKVVSNLHLFCNFVLIASFLFVVIYPFED
jgi:hypothetical protein